MKKPAIIRLVVALVVVGTIGAIAYANMSERSTPAASEATTPHMNDTHTDNSDRSSTPQASNEIIYKNFDVSPSTITVKAGTTVTWINQDGAKHDVTPVTETEDFKASALFGKGEAYSVTFNTPGSYQYFCSPHPYMKGTVEVTE